MKSARKKALFLTKIEFISFVFSAVCDIIFMDLKMEMKGYHYDKVCVFV